MSEKVKTLAVKYYPLLWPKERLDALLAAGKLTQDEYDGVVGTKASSSGSAAS